MLTLGERMKRYEQVTQRTMPPNSDLILRLDGRAFHTLTKDVPMFDNHLSVCMYIAMGKVMEDIGATAVMGYTQSDEISILLSDVARIEWEHWFGGRVDKIITIAAAIASTSFSMDYKKRVGLFDARLFLIPRQEVPNYFLWRAQDCARNSLSTLCQAHFTQKQLEGKKKQDQHDMLFEIGKNWTRDVPARFRNGIWLTGNDEHVSFDVKATYPDVAQFVEDAYQMQRERIEL